MLSWTLLLVYTHTPTQPIKYKSLSLSLSVTDGGDGPESPRNARFFFALGLPPPVLLPWNATVRAVKRSNSAYGQSEDMGLWQMMGTIVA